MSIVDRNPCPTCNRPPEHVVLGAVYPTQIGSEREVLVCWPCWRGKPLRGKWQDINRKRHEREWKREKHDNAEADAQEEIGW